MIHGVHVVYGRWCDMYKSRNLCGNIKKGMEFYSTFSFTKLCPPENAQTEIYCRGIKCIYLAFYLKIFISPLIPGDADQMVSKLLEYLAAPALVSFGQVPNDMISYYELPG